MRGSTGFRFAAGGRAELGTNQNKDMSWHSTMPIRSPTGMAKAGSAGSRTRPGSTPILVRRPGAGGSDPDGGRLHRYCYRALRCFHPVGEGATRDAAIDDAVKMTFEVGPLSRALADQPDDIRARASAAVRAAFAGRPGERSVMIDSATWIVTARNPAS